MVRAKKICSLIFAVLLIFAVCAPCALGVSADDSFNITFSNYQVSAGRVYASSSSLPVSAYYSGGSYYSFIFRYSDLTFSGDRYFDLEFTISLDVFTFLDSSMLTIRQNSSVIPSANIQVNEVIPTVSGYSIHVSFLANSGVVNNYLNLTFENFVPQSSQTVTVTYCLGAYSSSPFPSPSDDDEWTLVTPQSFYSSLDPLGNGYNSQLITDNFMDYSLTEGDFTVPVNSTTTTLLQGADFGSGILVSDIFHNYNAIQIITSMCVTDLIQSSVYHPDISLTIYLANGNDPLSSNYQQVDITQAGLTTDPFIRLSSSQLSDYSTYYTAYLGFSLDGLNVSFTPTSIQFVFSSSTVHHSYVYWVPRTYRMKYIGRVSDQSPLPSDLDPDPVPPVDQYATQINTEYDWYYKSLDETSGQFHDIDMVLDAWLIDSLDPSHVFDIYNGLYNAISYSGTSGDIIFPAADIPFTFTDSSHSNLHLWDQQTIPFRYYIDHLPNPIRHIIAALVFLSTVSVGFTVGIAFIRTAMLGDFSIGIRDK